MEKKISIIGDRNVGKTTTLRILIYLLTKSIHFSSITVFLPKCGTIIKGKTYVSLQANLYSLIFNRADIRVLITLIKESKEYNIAVGTAGDDPEAVRLNWQLFNDRYGHKKPETDFDICISPCHKNDRSTVVELMEYNWRMGTHISSILKPIYSKETYLIDKLHPQFLYSNLTAMTDLEIDQLIIECIQNGILKKSKKSQAKDARFFAAKNAFTLYNHILLNLLNNSL